MAALAPLKRLGRGLALWAAGDFLGLAFGGTGSTTAAGARSNLGAAASGANSDITSLTGLSTLTTTGNATIGGVLSVAGSVASGDAIYAYDRSGTGHRSAIYRNNDTTRLWDYAYGDTIVYDTAGNVTIPGKLSIGTPLAAASGGTGAAVASAGQVFAGPVSGAAAAPGFRAIAFSDLPAGIGSSPINLSLSAAVASNALTVSVLGANGAAPSASNPVYIPFKASGGLTWLAVTSPLSLTVPSGATLGTRNGAAARIWIVAINNGGAPLLCVQVCTDGATAIYTIGQSYPRTSVAISSSSGTAGTLYAASAVTGPITVLGCVEATEATAGTWATAPSVVRRWMPGDKLPGDVEQIISNGLTTPSNNNTNLYGPGALTATIALTSACNVVQASLSGANLNNPGQAVTGYVRIARNNTASGATVIDTSSLNVSNGGSGTAQVSTPLALDGLDWPYVTGNQTYGVQIKNSDNSTNMTLQPATKMVLKLAELVV